MKKRSGGREVGTRFLVVEENNEMRRGEVVYFFDSSPSSAQISTFWVLASGSWKLDVSRAFRVEAPETARRAKAVSASTPL